MVDAPVKIVVVYHSGYDHSARIAAILYPLEELDRWDRRNLVCLPTFTIAPRGDSCEVKCACAERGDLVGMDIDSETSSNAPKHTHEV